MILQFDSILTSPLDSVESPVYLLCGLQCISRGCDDAPKRIVCEMDAWSYFGFQPSVGSICILKACSVNMESVCTQRA